MGTRIPGKVVIISGPSGAGKSTVLRLLLQRCPLPLEMSISATTRAPRQGEVDGVDYHFLSPQGFERRKRADEFLECKEVYGRGDWYGTLREPVTTGLAAGKWVVLEIDVAGALAVLERVPDAVTIFLHPGSMDELERRLRRRHTDTDEAIQRRLEVARDEMQYLDRYQFEVINRDRQQAAREICEILQHCGETSQDA